MRFFVTLSRRHLAVILALLIIGLIVFGQAVGASSETGNGSTNALRTEYIKQLGIEIDDSNAEAKEIIVPKSFGEVYTEYNKLQKKAGFDLKRYKGEKATVYTYPIVGGEKQLHLIVCNGCIIGGDIADISVNGEMTPLLRQK